MRLLRAKLVFPVLQLVIAMTLLHIGNHTHQPPGLDTPYAPTSILVCNGINAPAVQLSNFRIFVPANWIGNPEWSIFGADFHTLFFLICVAFFWYLVGCELDWRRSPEVATQKGITVTKSIVTSFLFLLGVLLSLNSMKNFGHLQDLGRDNNVVGNLVAGALFWTWSLLLISICGYGLANEIRQRCIHPKVTNI
jgi:hypothetical protein